MTVLTIIITAFVMTGAVLLFYFFGERFYKRIESVMFGIAKPFNRFLLFILPMILILVVFLPISLFKINESISVFNFPISSNYIDLVFILSLAVFHKIKDKTHYSFSELFHAYKSTTETKCVVFANQVIACLFFIVISHFCFGFNSAITWWVFLLGRFVWLDQIDRSQIQCFKDGIRAQGWVNTLFYVGVFSFIFALSYFTAQIIPNFISDGVPGGIFLGSIISLFVMVLSEKIRHRKAAALSRTTPVVRED